MAARLATAKEDGNGNLRRAQSRMRPLPRHLVQFMSWVPSQPEKMPVHFTSFVALQSSHGARVFVKKPLVT